MIEYETDPNLRSAAEARRLEDAHAALKTEQERFRARLEYFLSLTTGGLVGILDALADLEKSGTLDTIRELELLGKDMPVEWELEWPDEIRDRVDEARDALNAIAPTPK